MVAGITQQNPTKIQVMEEMKNIIDIVFPILAMGILNYLKNLISVVCMGRLGSLELAGGALAIGFTNITGYSVLSGLAMGMEPLCSQAFGSKNLDMVSLTLRRTIIMLLFASVPIGMLWMNLEPIMIWLQQEPQVVHIASQYCQLAIPDLIVNSLLHPIRIYLRSRGIKWPLVWCSLPAMLLHTPVTLFLTFSCHLGLQGIAISTFITNLNTLFFLLGYMYYTFEEKTPKQFALKSSFMEDWGLLLRLSITSSLGVCLEWWWYEIMTILAGYLSKPQVTLATSAIVIQTTSLMYTVPSALSASISTRVGNELGAGRPDKARLATSVAISMAFLASTFSVLLTTVGREAWGKVFTDDKQVLELTSLVLPLIGLCELANCPQTTCCGVLRGSARPSTGAFINFCSFYLMGTPVAIALAFYWKMGFLGLCYGLLAAQIMCISSIIIVICKATQDIHCHHLV